MNTDIYQSSLVTRYASSQMSEIFSAQYKYSTWRKLWVALAEAEAELGLPISQEQIHELKSFIDKIDFSLAQKYESEVHHDVMAHIHAYGDQCPGARPIIHWGATSCYVTDNTDLLQIREGIKILLETLKKAIKQLAKFASHYASLPCLGFTHFQPAQLTTLGKRACLWLQDFVLDYDELSYRLDTIHFLGVKGATGTQAAFLNLFNGEKEKVKRLDQLISEKMHFKNVFSISGQTYTRKQDIFLLQSLGGIASSAHKFGTDLRLLAHLKEVEEPFANKQIGSSAMPYKRNPILSERMCGLSRFLISLMENPQYTAATQWLERSLDDSSNRRIVLPEAFLSCDAILETLVAITHNLIVYPKMIEKHIEEELPFIATENILMAGVKKGGDRQKLHERIRQHSLAAGVAVKEQGAPNDLVKRLSQDPAIPLSEQEMAQTMDISTFVGRAEDQVHDYLGELEKKISGLFEDGTPYA